MDGGGCGSTDVEAMVVVKLVEDVAVVVAAGRPMDWKELLGWVGGWVWDSVGDPLLI